MRSEFRLVLALLVLIGLSGCDSGADIASVKGTVTMDGKPLADASVLFIPSATGGRPAGARTDASGNYELNFSGGRKGTIPGPNSVKISTAQGPSQDENGNSIPSKPETVPLEYNDQTTLEFNVEDGKRNVANFDLKSGGKIAAPQKGGY